MNSLTAVNSRAIARVHQHRAWRRAIAAAAAIMLAIAIIASALFVLSYILLGGLSSAIYNEVMQFFVIFAGLVPVVIVALKETGGIGGLFAKLSTSGHDFTSAWSGVGLGGHNPMIVMDDADLERAVEAAYAGAFWSAGQKCTATRRIYVQDAVYDSFREQFLARIDRGRVVVWRVGTKIRVRSALQCMRRHDGSLQRRAAEAWANSPSASANAPVSEASPCAARALTR